jgi:predicted dehydrogenase
MKNIDSVSKNINIGVIGAGRWGPNLIGSINRINKTKVVQVADLNQTSLSQLQSRFPNITTTKSSDDILDDKTIDGVVISTPVASHIDLVEKALTKGKHVFVEKPFGNNTQRSLDMCLLAESENLHIMVGYVFLFNETIIALKKIIENGELGKILHLESHRTNLGPVRKDVNAVWDLTSHDLSIFDFLLQDRPEYVSCLGSSKLDENVADTAFTTFKYQNDIIAHAHASWLNPRKVRQITVIGDKKMALWDDLNLEHPITIYDSSIGLDQSYYSDSYASHRLSYNRGDVVLPSIKTNEPLLAEMNHFINVIRGTEENKCSGIYATEMVRTLSYANESLCKDGSLIKIER